MNLEKLLSEGWAVFIDPWPNAEQLCAIAQRMSDQYRPARIGRENVARQVNSIRSDKILWLDAEVDPRVAQYLANMDQLRREINQQWFLGLFNYECHFARFSSGDFYKTHLDAFADVNNPSGNRKLSSVYYLNKDWQPEDGGELVIYSPQSGAELVRVTPKLGTLVLFLSEEFPHEVLPSRRERYSLTGWFRTRPEGN